MKITTLAPIAALAALSLAACTPKGDAANNTAATDTLTLNEEGDAGLGNADDFATGNDVVLDNGTAGDNAAAPAAGNAL